MTDQSIEEFLTAFNRVHKAICRELDIEDTTEFAKAVRAFGEKRTSWPHTNNLLTIARLRNVLVHEQQWSKQYLAIPSLTTMQMLNRALDALERPEVLVPRFQRPVQVLSPNDPLSDVLARIHKADYSQFPVYDGDTFKGLLTENGIVAFLAEHRVSQMTLIDFAEVQVRQLLKHDENRRNFEFVARNEHLDIMLQRFANQPTLEAVLITANGKRAEKLIGIATQWDAMEAIKSLHAGRTANR
jgi:predicted transcriptional regulator